MVPTNMSKQIKIPKENQGADINNEYKVILPAETKHKGEIILLQTKNTTTGKNGQICYNDPCLDPRIVKDDSTLSEGAKNR